MRPRQEVAVELEYQEDGMAYKSLIPSSRFLVDNVLLLVAWHALPLMSKQKAGNIREKNRTRPIVIYRTLDTAMYKQMHRPISSQTKRFLV